MIPSGGEWTRQDGTGAGLPPFARLLCSTGTMKRRSPGPILLCAALAIAGCSNAAGETGRTTLAATSTQATIRTTTTVPATTTEAPPPDRRQLPTTAAELAGELAGAEAAIRDAQVDGATAAAWGRRQQLLYRLLAVNEQWASETIAAIDEPMRSAVDANWTARRELSSLVTGGQLSTVLPAWRIRQPLGVEELRAYYEEAQALTGIGWEYLAAINLIETRMGRIEGLSTAGATGPMQFLPSTWEECCDGDPTIDRDAIIGAGVYLRARGGPDDMRRALFGYNSSDYYVNAVSAYAEVLRSDPMALRGYHAWEVFFRSEPALVRLPVGYEELEPVDALEWIATNPEYVLD